MIAIAVYIAAACGANFLASAFGPSVTPFTAFALVGAAMAARDTLHERWCGSTLTWKMALLIFAASCLSCLFASSTRVCAASFVAFLVSESLDAVVFSFAPRRHRIVISNSVSAPIDSVAFLVLAFGTVPVIYALGQIALKIAAGSLYMKLKPLAFAGNAETKPGAAE